MHQFRVEDAQQMLSLISKQILVVVLKGQDLMQTIINVSDVMRLRHGETTDANVLINGYARWNGACRKCPKSSALTSDDSTCECFSRNSIYISLTNICVDCSTNSIPNNART